MDHSYLIKLFTEDKISRIKDNVSPIYNNKKWATWYNFNYCNSFIFPLTSILLGFTAYNKRHTGRQIYIVSTASFAVFGFLSNAYRKNLRTQLISIWKCNSEEEFDTLIDFYTKIKITPNREDSY